MIKTIIFDLGNKKFTQDSNKPIDNFIDYYENSSTINDFKKGKFSSRILINW